VRSNNRLSRTFAVVVGSIAAMLLAALCCPPRATTSQTLASSTAINGAGHPMLTSPQALEIGYSALKSIPGRDSPGDIVAELTKSTYRVRFFFVIALDRKLDHLVEVSIDPDSGNVLKTEDKGQVAGLQERSAQEGWEKFLSGKQAYDLAVASLQGFENYDKQGPLTVELRKDVYYITFPLKRTPKMGSRVSAYATQVWIDARSGKLLKRLVAA
jgi:hypothetical protein